MALNDDQIRNATRLGCGRSIDDVWARIDRAPDAHERTCPDCRAARESLARLRVVTDELRDGPTAGPSGGVKDSVMAVARAEVRRGRRLEVRTTEAGPISISEQTVTAVVRDAADRVPGVHARRCKITLDSTDDRSVIPEAGVRQLDIALGVALSRRRRIPVVLAELRERIASEVRDRLGVAAARIDVTVEDLYDVDPTVPVAALDVRRAS